MAKTPNDDGNRRKKPKRISDERPDPNEEGGYEDYRPDDNEFGLPDELDFND